MNFFKAITYGNDGTWQLQEDEAEEKGVQSMPANTLLSTPDWSQHYSLGSNAYFRANLGHHVNRKCA